MLHRRRHGREQIQPGGCFDGIDAGAVGAPRGADGILVGRVDGDDAGGAAHAGGVVGAHGQHHHHFPAAGRHPDAALVERGGEAVAAGAALPVAAADDVDLVALAHQHAAVVLQVGPRLLVVARGVGHHVGHQERGRVVGHRCRAVGAGAVVAPVEARAGVAGGPGAVPAGGQGGVGPEVVLPVGRTLPVGGQVPTHPVGLALVAVVAHGVLELVEQVVRRLAHVGGGPAGVAQREVFGQGRQRRANGEGRHHPHGPDRDAHHLRGRGLEAGGGGVGKGVVAGGQGGKNVGTRRHGGRDRRPAAHGRGRDAGERAEGGEVARDAARGGGRLHRGLLRGRVAAGGTGGGPEQGAGGEAERQGAEGIGHVERG